MVSWICLGLISFWNQNLFSKPLARALSKEKNRQISFASVQPNNRISFLLVQMKCEISTQEGFRMLTETLWKSCIDLWHFAFLLWDTETFIFSSSTMDPTILSGLRTAHIFKKQTNIVYFFIRNFQKIP